MHAQIAVSNWMEWKIACAPAAIALKAAAAWLREFVRLAVETLLPGTVADWRWAFAAPSPVAFHGKEREVSVPR